MMHREAFIAKLAEIQETVEQLLAQLRPTSTTSFRLASPVRRNYRSACERAGKSGKQSSDA